MNMMVLMMRAIPNANKRNKTKPSVKHDVAMNFATLDQANNLTTFPNEKCW